MIQSLRHLQSDFVFFSLTQIADPPRQIALINSSIRLQPPRSPTHRSPGVSGAVFPASGLQERRPLVRLVIHDERLHGPTELLQVLDERGEAAVQYTHMREAVPLQRKSQQDGRAGQIIGRDFDFFLSEGALQIHMSAQ